MDKLLILMLASLVISCGDMQEEPIQSATEKPTLEQPESECPLMDPVGPWLVTSTWLVGSCGEMPPYLVSVNESGQLHVDQGDCTVIKRMVVEHRCQQVTMVECVSPGNNIKASMHFFLKKEYIQSKVAWTGNVNISISSYDTGIPLCENIYEAIVTPYVSEQDTQEEGN